MDIFTAMYFVAIVAEIVIRAPINQNRKQQKVTESRYDSQEKILLLLLSIGMFFVPIIYGATDWLDFANYSLPIWARWLGVLLISLALFVFWRAHADLGLNWSPTLEIREHHDLVTQGIYAVIRHAMYASQWLWVIAQPLLLPNWIAGFLNLLVFIPFYFLRVREEEKLMLDQFGEQYRSYMQKVGGVVPRF